MNADATKRPRSRRFITVALALFVAVTAMPWLFANTPLRDRLLAAILKREDLRVSSDNASFGYFSPLALGGLRIETLDTSTQLNVDQIEADRSWVRLLVSRSDLGRFQFDRPSVDVLVREEMEESAEVDETTSPEATHPPKMILEIRDASIVVRTPSTAQPPIDLDKINVTVQIDADRDRSVLRVQPLQLFDHQTITPELCSQGLQLVAPMLDRQLDASGEFSLRFTEFQIPLGDADADRRSKIRISGELELHEMSASVKNPLTRRIAGVALDLIGSSLPETTMIARGVNVRFNVIDGRVHHEGLALLIPRGESSIEITSSGSVGLDESLDLQVAIRLPANLLGESQLASKLTGAPIMLAIGGTLDEPEIGLPERIDWVRSIETMLNASPDDAPRDSLEENVADVLGQLLKGALDREPSSEADAAPEPRPILPNLRDWLRSRRDRTNDPRANDTPNNETESEIRIPIDI